jgi:hypothetical protein
MLERRVGLKTGLAPEDTRPPWAHVLHVVITTPPAGDAGQAVIKFVAQDPLAEDVDLAPFAPGVHVRNQGDPICESCPRWHTEPRPSAFCRRWR